MTRKQVDQKYLSQANALETEFFDIVNEGLPSQHRVLKAGKSIDEFNQRHGKIWHNHEAELVAEGYIEAPIPRKPPRDAFAEIGNLEARVEKLEKR